MMPFYGASPAEAAHRLIDWMRRAHERQTAAAPPRGGPCNRGHPGWSRRSRAILRASPRPTEAWWRSPSGKSKARSSPTAAATAVAPASSIPCRRTATAARTPSSAWIAAATATCRSTASRWGMFATWPGPIHLGNGTFQVIVDERADARQRAALEAIGQGRDTEPGSLIWQVFSTTVTTLLAHDLCAASTSRSTSMSAPPRCGYPALGESTASPIRNRKTGAPQRVAGDAARRLRVHRRGVRGRLDDGRRRHPARLRVHPRAPGAHPLVHARRGAVVAVQSLATRPDARSSAPSCTIAGSCSASLGLVAGRLLGVDRADGHATCTAA